MPIYKLFIINNLKANQIIDRPLSKQVLCDFEQYFYIFMGQSCNSEKTGLIPLPMPCPNGILLWPNAVAYR